MSSSSELHNQNTLNDLNDNHLSVMPSFAKYVILLETQRVYVKKKAKDVVVDKVDGFGWKNRIYCFCGDYSQNLTSHTLGRNNQWTNNISVPSRSIYLNWLIIGVTEL